MDPSRVLFFGAVIVAFLAGFGASASFISGEVLQARGSTGRSLLQAKQSCPINFEFLNYTIIISQCKGPQYLAKPCCGALKEFACPYAAELNDVTTECASTMFSYINLYGKYPPGLFASECREGKNGLACPALSPEAADIRNTNSSAAQKNWSISLLLVALVTGFMLHFQFS